MRKRGQQGQNTEFKTYNIMICLLYTSDAADEL